MQWVEKYLNAFTIVFTVATTILYVWFFARLIRRPKTGSSRHEVDAKAGDTGGPVSDGIAADEDSAPFCLDSEADRPEPQADFLPPPHDLNALIRDFDELGFVGFRMGRDAEQFDMFTGFLRKRNVRMFTHIDHECGVIMICRRPQTYIWGGQ